VRIPCRVAAYLNTGLCPGDGKRSGRMAPSTVSGVKNEAL
jgi:hypothetical protein